LKPFLSLSRSDKKKVSDILLAYSVNYETFRGVRSAFEEFVDESKLKSIIAKLEERGDLKPGLWRMVEGYLAGSKEVGDVDRIPREVDGF
jgi:hypothetical protein